jgi:hypothetical protein
MKKQRRIDMSSPPEVAFNPEVNKVPVLDASSGNPKSFQDPKSVASIGAKIQAMTDQAKADTLYDSNKEGFRGMRFRSGGGFPKDPRIAALIILGMGLILASYFK